MARITSARACRASQLDKAQFAERLKQRFQDPAFEPLQAEIDKIIDAAWDGYDDSRKAPYTRPAGPAIADPDIRALGRLARRNAMRSTAPSGGRSRRVDVAHPADRRLAAQRPDLPGRDVQELSPGGDRRGGDRARARLRGRAARPQPAHLGVRPADPSLQGLRVDGDAALPLALLLLSQPFARARSTTGWARSIRCGPPRTAS